MTNETNSTPLYVPPAWQTDYTRQGALAVLYGDTVSFYTQTDHLIPQALAYHSHRYTLDEADTLLTVARLLLGMRIETLLILPALDSRDCDFVRTWRDTVPGVVADAPAHDLDAHILPGKELTAFYAGVVFRSSADSGARGPALTCYLLGGDAWGLTERLASENVPDAQRAQAVANSWLLAQWALGIRLRFSPSYMGQLTMRVALGPAVRKAPERFVGLPEEWQETLRGIPASYFTWFQPDNARRADGIRKGVNALHVWCYDRNWSFVSSARRVPLGIPRAVSSYGGKPGVYLVNASAPEPERTNGGRLQPGYFRAPDGSYPPSVSRAWVWQPQLDAALKAGWDVRVLRGYAFSDSYDLRPWQDMMWRARRMARAAQARARTPWQRAAMLQAEGIIKRAGVAGIGRLNQSSGHTIVPINGSMPSYHIAGDLSRDPASGLADDTLELERTPMLERYTDMMRPHWWNTIVSGASERLTTTLRGYAGLGLAGYIDAGYFVIEVPELTARGADVAGSWHEEASGVLVPGEALKAGLGSFVSTVARAKRARGLTYAN